METVALIIAIIFLALLIRILRKGKFSEELKDFISLFKRTKKNNKSLTHARTK